DRALYLLSSTDANVERLMGEVGLPTRKLSLTAVSSRLRGSSGEAGPVTTLTYGEVLNLGVKERSDEFHWLWRGNLGNYHSVAPIWERWLYRALRRWKTTREFFAVDWISGFELYDDIAHNKIKRVQDRTLSYDDFQVRIGLLCEELVQQEQR